MYKNVTQGIYSAMLWRKEMGDSKIQNSAQNSGNLLEKSGRKIYRL
jgi:hypothetical protein